MDGKIYAALCAAMSEMDAIGKESKNQQQGFMYRGIDAVMNTLNPVLKNNKIFVMPEVLEHKREERLTKSGGNLIYSILKIKYTFYAEDGSCVSAVVIGEGMDSADKSSNKAMSVAFKYACFQVLCIPTEETKDPDADSPPPTEPQPILCPTCKKAIQGIKVKGEPIFPEQILKQYGSCYPCYKAQKAESNG